MSSTGNKKLEFEFPTQNTINSIIQASVANVTPIETIIKSVASTIAKLANDKNVQNISKNVKIFNTLNNVINNFINISNLLITTFCTKSPDGKTLQELLGYIEYYETNSTVEKTINDKKSKYTVIESITQISGVISTIVKMFESLSKMNMGWKDMIRFKKNLWFLKSQMREVFFTFLDVFSDISSIGGMDNILTILTGTPEETMREIEKDILDESTNDKKGLIDKTKDFTITTGKKQGIMDVMLKTFDLFKMMFEMKVPNGILFKVKLLKLGYILKSLWGILLDFSKGINPQSFEQLDLIISGKAEQVVKKPDGTVEVINPQKEGLMSIMNKIELIFETISETKTKSKKLKKFSKTLVQLRQLITKINETFNNEDIIDIIKDKFIQRLDKLSTEVLDKLSDIFKTLALMSIIAIPFVLGGFLFIKAAFWCLNLIINSIVSLNNKLKDFDIKNLTNNLSLIDDVIKSLMLISLRLTLMIPLAITGFVGAIVTILFTVVLIGFVWLLKKLLKLIEEIAEDSMKSTKKILLLIGSLMLIGVSILLFAIVTPIIVKALTGYVLPFILILGISIFTMYIMLKIAQKVAQNAVKDSIKLAIFMVIIGGCLLMATLTLTQLNEVGQMLVDGGGVVNIIAAIAGIIAVSAVMIGLGLALSFVIPFIAPAIPALLVLVAVLGTTLLAAKTMESLGKIEVDLGEYEESEKEGGSPRKAKGLKGTVGQILSFVPWILEQLSKNDMGFFNSIKTTAKLAAADIMIFKVRNTLNRITKVGESLKSIGNLYLDEDKITTNIEKLFTFANSLDEKISKFVENEKPSTLAKDLAVSATVGAIFPVIGVGMFIGSVIKRRQEDKFNKADKKLNKIQQIITPLVNVGNSLSSIQNLKLDEDKITTNIEKLFTFINRLDGEIARYMSEPAKLQNQDGEVYTTTKPLSRRQLRKANKRLNKVESIINTLNNVSQAINNIKNFKITDKEKDSINTNISLMFDTVDLLNTTIQTKLKDKDTIDEDDLNNFTIGLNSISESIETFSKVDASNMKKNIDNYAKFIDKINTIEVEKVKATTDMFKQMSEFSNSIKGDFDKLAEALSEKLLPVLEDLKEVMGVLPEKIDSGFNKTSASIGAAASPQSKESIEAQVIRENPSLNKEEVEKIVSNRLNEKANADANGLTAKLDELISLLKGNSGERVLVEVL